MNVKMDAKNSSNLTEAVTRITKRLQRGLISVGPVAYLRAADLFLLFVAFLNQHLIHQIA